MRTYTSVRIRPEHGRFVLKETGTVGEYKIEFQMKFLKPTEIPNSNKIHDINPKLKNIQKSVPLCDIYENNSSASHADVIYFYDRSSSIETDYEGIVASNPPFGSAYEEYVNFPLHIDGIHRDDVALNPVEATVKGVGSNVLIEPEIVYTEGLVSIHKDPIKDRTPPFDKSPVITNDWEVDIPLRWVYGGGSIGKWSIESSAPPTMKIMLKSKTVVAIVSEDLRNTGIKLTWNSQDYFLKSVKFNQYTGSYERVNIGSSSAIG